MKKLVILLIVLICVLFLAIGSCVFAVSRSRCSVWLDNSVDEHGFFGQSRLDRLDIPDLPKIQSEQETTIRDGTFRYHTSLDSFEEYVESVYEYLISQKFDYFGYPSEYYNSWFSIELNGNIEDFLNPAAYYECAPEKVLSGADNIYFFVWGDEEGYQPNLTLHNYIILGYDSQSDNKHNAFIRIPYHIMDFRFKLPSISHEIFKCRIADEDFATLWSFAENCDKKDNDMHIPIIHTDNRAELDNFITSANSIYKLDESTGGYASFMDTAAQFDDHFFENNTLFLLPIKKGTQLYNSERPVSIRKGKELRFVVDKATYESAPEEQVSSILVIVIERADYPGDLKVTASYNR